MIAPAWMVVGVTVILCSCGSRAQNLYSGTLQSPSAAVGSTLGGRVVQVLTSEGSRVTTGQVLVRLDDAQQRSALASAIARVGQARASLADLRAGTRKEDLAHTAHLAQQQRAQYELAASTTPYQVSVLRNQLRQARSQVADARAALAQAHADADRMRALYVTGDTSAQTRDAAVEREAHARAQLTSSVAAVRAARSQLANAAVVTLPQDAAAALAGYRAAQDQYRSLAAGARPDQIRQAEATLRGAQADVIAARSRFDETVVRAPAPGMVTAMDLHRGDLVAPGASVATIEESGNPYVRIYVPQASLGAVKLGATLGVHSDALPGVAFEGVVEQIDSQAQFTPENVQTASDRAVLSFGVKVRVHDPQQRLHPGTTVDVAVP